MRVRRGGVARAGVLVVLVLLGCSLRPIGQSAAPPSVDGPSHGAAKPVTTATVKGTAVTADGDLQLVVAVFRHGIRAPLKDFAERADIHSAKSWPLLPEWVGLDSGLTWGDLTIHGREAVAALGAYHGKRYKDDWPNGYNVFLWADVDNRTLDTAYALAQGFKASGIHATVHSRTDGEQDPLFHAYRAQCGRPNHETLGKIAADIKNNWQEWHDRYKLPFVELYLALGCVSANTCTPLSHVTDTAKPCLDQKTCSLHQSKILLPLRPVEIELVELQHVPKLRKLLLGLLSASEAFLLEFANGMPNDKVGWGRVAVLSQGLQSHPGDPGSVQEEGRAEHRRTVSACEWWQPVRRTGLARHESCSPWFAARARLVFLRRAQAAHPGYALPPTKSRVARGGARLRVTQTKRQYLVRPSRVRDPDLVADAEPIQSGRSVPSRRELP